MRAGLGALHDTHFLVSRTHELRNEVVEELISDRGSEKGAERDAEFVI